MYQKTSDPDPCYGPYYYDMTVLIVLGALYKSKRPAVMVLYDVIETSFIVCETYDQRGIRTSSKRGGAYGKNIKMVV